MEERGLARATVGRRLSTVSGFHRFAVVDGLLAHPPAEFIRRPNISAESALLADSAEHGDGGVVDVKAALPASLRSLDTDSVYGGIDGQPTFVP